MSCTRRQQRVVLTKGPAPFDRSYFNKSMASTTSRNTKDCFPSYSTRFRYNPWTIGRSSTVYFVVVCRSKETPQVKISVYGINLEHVEQLKNLGQLITADRKTDIDKKNRDSTEEFYEYKNIELKNQEKATPGRFRKTIASVTFVEA